MKKTQSNNEKKNTASQHSTGISEAFSNLASNVPFKYILGSDEDSYDPFKHRHVENPSNNWQTMANVIKSAFGAGILAMPQAFVYAGLIVGTLGTLLLGILVIFCTHLFVKGSRLLCTKQRKPLMSYKDSFKAACTLGPPSMRCFAKYADCIADVILLILQEGLCIVYSIFCATTAKAVLDAYIPDYSLRIYILICGIPLLFLACIRSLRNMAPISMFANLCTITAVLIIVIYSIVTEPLPVDMEMVGDFMKYPLFFGTVMFAFCNIGMIMSIENNMAHPEDFLKPFGVLNVGMGIVISAYILMGMVGYYFCRTLCKGTITDNMPQSSVGIVVQIIVGLSIFISFMLNNYTVVEIGWGHWVEPCLRRRGTFDENDKLRKYEYAFRILAAVATILIAAAVPSLGDIISLIGAFCMSILGVLFPALVYASYINMKGITNFWRGLVIFLLILLSVFALATGTYGSLRNIIKTYFPE